MKIVEITQNFNLNTIKLDTNILALIRKYWPKSSRKGECTIEYIMFVVTMVILATAIGPRGWLTKKIDKSFRTTQDKVTREVKCMYLSPFGCPITPNNGCCEAGETSETGTMDCM